MGKRFIFFYFMKKETKKIKPLSRTIGTFSVYSLAPKGKYNER